MVEAGSQRAKIERFRAAHQPGTPLLLANAWDAGTAKVLALVGFEALATTSSGFAATLGRPDGAVTADEALDHSAAIVNATDLPVSADLENGFGDEPAAVADTMRRASDCGLAGCSIEDFSGDERHPIYEPALATERIVAAVEAARSGPGIVLTARTENYLHDRPDLADTIARLQSFQAAGADVLYAPGLYAIDDIRQVVAEVDGPVNILALPGGPTVAELAEVGVARVSVGGAFGFAGLAAVADAGRELIEHGTYGFWQQAGIGSDLADRTHQR